MIGIELRGAETFVNASRKARARLKRTVYRSLNKSLSKPATARRRMTRAQPMIAAIARSAWGKRDKNKLTARVKVIGPWVRDNAVNAGIGMYGYAAAARTGDRIVPHAIRHGSVTIMHPGARIVPQISGGRTLTEAPTVLLQLNEDVGKMLKATYGV